MSEDRGAKRPSTVAPQPGGAADAYGPSRNVIRVAVAVFVLHYARKRPRVTAHMSATPTICRRACHSHEADLSSTCG